jgi:phage gp16-like protein
MNRAALIKLIKTGQRFMGWDDATYRAWLEKHTGKRSCADCSEAELSRLRDDLRANGFQPSAASKPRGGGGPCRPSEKQWAYAWRLAKEKGYTGLDDPGLVTLCRRVAKVDNPRFLDKDGMRALILALGRWIAHGKAKRAAPKQRNNPGAI